MEIKRDCEGCTKCCEGWLWSEAYGHKFWPGRPCHFMCEKGCSIYENRPVDPCKNFKCEWLTNSDIPEWMKPSVSNVIICKRIENNNELLEFTEVLEFIEAGSRLDPRVLSWIFMNFVNKKIGDVKYQLDGGWNYIYG